MNNGNIFTKIFLIISFFTPITISAQEKITVSAFYSYEHFLDKDNVIDSTWSIGTPLQIRVDQEWETPQDKKYVLDTYFWIADLAPFLFYNNLHVETESGTKTMTARDFNDMEMKNDRLKRLSYSYNSVTTRFANTDYLQAFYAMPIMQKWYATSEGINDSVNITFNVDTTLFYIRANKQLRLNEHRQYSLRVRPEDEMPSFYLFYLPAYKHLRFTADNHRVDVLFNRVGKSQKRSLYLDISKQVPENLQPRLTEVLCKLDTLFGNGPKNIDFVLAPQDQYGNGSDSKSKPVKFSRVHYYGGDYALVLMHQDWFENNTMVHELIHAFVSNAEINDFNTFAGNMIGESLVEYLSVYMSQTMLGDEADYYKKKLKTVSKKNLDDTRILSLLSTINKISVSLGEDHSQDTGWIYYDLIPLRMHEYAQSTGREGEFARAVADYLVSVKQHKVFSLDGYAQFMIDRGFAGVLDNIKTIIPPEE